MQTNKDDIAWKVNCYFQAENRKLDRCLQISSGENRLRIDRVSVRIIDVKQSTMWRSFVETPAHKTVKLWQHVFLKKGSVTTMSHCWNVPFSCCSKYRVSDHLITFSSQSSWSGLFHLWIWTGPLLNKLEKKKKKKKKNRMANSWPIDLIRRLACWVKMFSRQHLVIFYQYSLWAQLIAKDLSFLHADSEDSDQNGRMPRLICLHWAHMPFCWCCHALAQITSILISLQTCPDRN